MASKAAAARMTPRSSKLLPTICMPVGTPLSAKPVGTDATGHWLTKLKGYVIAHCTYASMRFPLMRKSGSSLR